MASNTEHPDAPGPAATDADVQRCIDAIVLNDARVVEMVEAVFSAQNNARSGYDMLASYDWDRVVEIAQKLTVERMLIERAKREGVAHAK